MELTAGGEDAESARRTPTRRRPCDGSGKKRHGGFQLWVGFGNVYSQCSLEIDDCRSRLSKFKNLKPSCMVSGITAEVIS